MLGDSMVMYGGGLGDSNDHAHFDLPEIVVGGGAGRLKGGRHLVYPKDTPVNNLLVSMLDKVGVSAGNFGDATGRIKELADI